MADYFGPDALGETYPVAADHSWNWVVVAVPPRGGLTSRRRFAVSIEDGRWLKFPMHLKDGWWGNDGATFSENGATIVWLGPGEDQSTLPVWWSIRDRQHPRR